MPTGNNIAFVQYPTPRIKPNKANFQNVSSDRNDNNMPAAKQRQAITARSGETSYKVSTSNAVHQKTAYARRRSAHSGSGFSSLGLAFKIRLLARTRLAQSHSAVRSRIDLQSTNCSTHSKPIIN